MSIFWNNPLFNPSRALSENPRGGYFYKMSYQVVTEESAAEGDFAESGWEEERSKNYRSLKELLHDVSGKANWTEWSSTNPSGTDWITSEPEQDYRTGNYTSYDLFIKRNDGQPLSARDISYITDELGLHRFGRMMPRRA